MRRFDWPKRASEVDIPKWKGYEQAYVQKWIGEG